VAESRLVGALARDGFAGTVDRAGFARLYCRSVNLIGLLIVILLLGVLAAIVLGRVGGDGCPHDATTTTIVHGVTNPRVPGLCS
jgi:hypothetical protein